MWELIVKGKLVRKSSSFHELLEEMWDIIDASEATADECEIYKPEIYRK